MKKNLLLSLVAGLTIIFSCCNRQTNTLLECAENYLPAQPDSAAFCLSRIESVEELDEDQKALYGLLSTIVENHLGSGVVSDSLIRGSYNYYRKKSDAGQTSDLTLLRRYAQSCYYMSVFYTSCDSTQQCEQLLHQSIRGSEDCGDWHTCYLAHTLLSLTTSWENPQDAVQQALKALKAYHKINDDINNEVLIMGHVAASYLTASEPDSALEYYLKGYELAKEHQLKEAQNSMCMGLSDTYCYMGAFWHALFYAKIGIETADSAALVPSLLSLAQCYYACDSLDQAKAVLDTIPCDSDDYVSRYLALRTLSEIAVQRRDVDSLYAYVDSAYVCLEDRFIRVQQVKDASIAKEQKIVEVRHETELNQWIGAFIFIIILLVSGILFYYYHVRKHRISQPAEIPAEPIETALEQPQQRDSHTLTPAVQQQRLIQRLQSIYQHPSDDKQQKRAEKAWQEMEKLINETDHDFVQKLRQQYPDIKDKDIQLCMLVRLKVTNATIVNIFGIGESAVKKRKSTLKKTIFQITDPNITLEQVVNEI